MIVLSLPNLIRLITRRLLNLSNQFNDFALIEI